MRLRLFSVVAALVLMLAALPFAATAAAPDVARISATSYLDTAGNEWDSLCDQQDDVEIGAGYSGMGSTLGGTGTGNLIIELNNDYFDFEGEFEIDGETRFIYAEGERFCLTSGYALVSGGFTFVGPKESDVFICGDFAGYIMDGAHRNQGRVSLTLIGDPDECIT